MIQGRFPHEAALRSTLPTWLRLTRSCSKRLNSEKPMPVSSRNCPAGSWGGHGTRVMGKRFCDMWFGLKGRYRLSVPLISKRSYRLCMILRPSCSLARKGNHERVLPSRTEESAGRRRNCTTDVLFGKRNTHVINCYTTNKQASESLELGTFWIKLRVKNVFVRRISFDITSLCLRQLIYYRKA